MVKIAFDPYKVLQLHKGCTEKDIAKAYKVQCLKWHPDKNLNNKEEAENRFIQAKEAFDFLYDKQQREEYDRGIEKKIFLDEMQKERMEKADARRRKLINDLEKREKATAQVPDGLSPAQKEVLRKREEKQKREAVERMRKKLEEEVYEEIRAQNERIQKVINGQAVEEVTEAPRIKLKWKDSVQLDEQSIRSLLEKHGVVLAITPILKKKDSICMVDFEGYVDMNDVNKCCTDADVKVSWIVEPKSKPAPTEKGSETTDTDNMSYEELYAQMCNPMKKPRMEGANSNVI